MSYRNLWIALGIVIIASFAVLGTVGKQMIDNAPPVAAAVITSDGRQLFESEAIKLGQGVWQSLGGQEIGSIWGHGAYVAPDWSADWLHREAAFILDRWAKASGAASYEALGDEQKASLRARLERVMRTNTYDPATGRVTVDPVRAEAFGELSRHYADVFGNGRPEYAIPSGALTDTVKQQQLAAFFWWTSWAASTNRHGGNVTYTQNWPAEPLIGNAPTGPTLVWSVISFVLLLAGVGGMVWYFGSQERTVEHERAPERDPLLGLNPSASQRATAKFFYVVAALWVVQVALGAITAHYGVEGSGFYGIPIDRILPYSISRTWHLQIGIFWIATSWLATGLYVAPAVSGYEPAGQRLGVNLLFGALLLVVVGSLAGEWLGIQQKLGDAWFWFGSRVMSMSTSAASGRSCCLSGWCSGCG